ncbi:hypothetical protein EYC84_006903 [Monilinia fructicola]|uniref:Dolichol-phosphate mannosyltransferase subunit 3 n=1 Tax=Monilinia fructicola TaxID=38448 RepID=A0A5M9K8N6_MONFR|nr:hypothetical protein EYC84_006903 [Monilinia fructicola]
MTRAQQTISIGLLVTSLYLAVYLELVPLPGKVSEEIVPVLPFWVLVSFGAYLLGKLGYGVFTFNDVPKAHAELMEEIELARKDLRTKGVDWEIHRSLRVIWAVGRSQIVEWMEYFRRIIIERISFTMMCRLLWC